MSSSVDHAGPGVAEAYFRHVGPATAGSAGSSDHRAALDAHLRLARVRAPGQTLVMVHRPESSPELGASVQVVTDDMPMLVDSVTAMLTGLGADVLEIIHPVLGVTRSAGGDIVDIKDASAAAAAATLESWMHVRLHPSGAAAILDTVESTLGRVLADVRRVHDDTAAMLDAEQRVAARLASDHPDLAALLTWLTRDNFSLLGYRRYRLDGGRLEPLRESGLGILRAEPGEPDRTDDIDLPDRIDGGTDMLTLSQGSDSAAVHRSRDPYFRWPYFTAVQDVDDTGSVVGEHRFAGLFTVTALHGGVLDIPVVGDRVRSAIERTGHSLSSYSGQSMLGTVHELPRTELFSMDTETLFSAITTVESIGVRHAVLLLLRRDGYGRFVSALVYLPRNTYTTRVRLEIKRILMTELGGAEIEHNARVSESPLALVHFIVRHDPENPVVPDLSEDNRLRLESMIAAASRTWEDSLRDVAAGSAVVSPDLAVRYGEAFPDAYKQDFGAQRALSDILRLEALPATGIDLRLYRNSDSAAGHWRFSLYVGSDEVSLSRVLPVLQSLGVEVVDERPYSVVRPDGLRCWIYDFGLTAGRDVLRGALDNDIDAELAARSESAERVSRRFHDAFAAVWHGLAEADRFNELVLRAGMVWRHTVVLRAYAKYLRQAGFPYSQFNIEGVLLGNPRTAMLLVELFEAQFDPDRASTERAEEIAAELTSLIDTVVSLDADRILRAIFGLVRATLRTNHFVVDEQGRTREFLSLKFDPRMIDELPKPKPRFEIFVYSPRFEGVHLRFGPVARGGLRWSDRREDFRTEVLGLAKAQAVKNAVIVPVGAKGGFVVKRPPVPTGDSSVDRQATTVEGRACYRLFIAGLLDVTDNLDRATGATIAPARVVRRDADDSYLVVAADKGTATFSDLANEVSAEYGFWLGDAFASGGSVGYDHKAMGITAKGAWESVKRHFRERGIDTQTDDFTAVGIGDMSGDVFGNGMLLTEHLRIVAAFDHRHIILDPTPDAGRSFIERRRLYDLPRSSWADYDASLISDGGGVWERTVKSVPISAGVRSALGLADDITALSPPELMRAILRAPVDLLWNGGIGTYVKSSAESDGDVGDKANDAVRVDGAELRSRVVGEGGNLGFTALGRIEYAAAGGKINTDAIDNSAGVDCSDHEVNIKILIDALVTSGDLDSSERTELLASMTDEVGRLVLWDNVAQNELLGVSRSDAPALLGVHGRLISDLVERTSLDRDLEALPTKSEIARRAQNGTGLTSPELATLMAHVKLSLQADLLATDLPDGDAFSAEVIDYFPEPLRARFSDAMKSHPLRREIVATRIVNRAVDFGGITYAFRLAEDSGVGPTDAVRAFTATTAIFGMREIWESISTTPMPTAASDLLTLESHRLLDRGSRWLLSNRPQPVAIGAEITRFAGGVRRLEPRIEGWLQGRQARRNDDRAAAAIEAGAPTDLALRVYRLLDVFCLLDIIEYSDIGNHAEDSVAELYFALDEHLGVDWLLSAVSGLERGDRWHALARLALRDDLYASLRSLTLDVLAGGEPGETPAEMIAEWESTNASRLARARAALQQIGESGTLDLATLSVAAGQVRSMVRGTGTRSEGSR